MNYKYTKPEICVIKMEDLMASPIIAVSGETTPEESDSKINNMWDDFDEEQWYE